jgi:hypothetical protein
MKYKNGKSYTGEWLAFKRHGKGIVCKPDGTTYIGEYLEGKK